MKFILLVTLMATVAALAAAKNSDCARDHPEAHLTPKYNETIGHAIHAMTVEGLKLFSPKAGDKNFVPTVNQNLSAGELVTLNAPSDPVGADFSTTTMNVIDKILSTLGNSLDGLGPNWSPIERVAHIFHMWDLWHEIRQSAWEEVEHSPPSDAVCKCLFDVDSNGIKDAVLWVAEHYKSGTPITLLNRPIPKLTDAASWGVWKQRLLHYYTPEALKDAAMYLHCVSRRW